MGSGYSLSLPACPTNAPIRETHHETIFDDSVRRTHAACMRQACRRPTSRSCSRATASCMSAARPCRSTAATTSTARCMSSSASRPSRRTPIRSSWCTAARCPARTTPARRMAAKAGRNISCARATPSMSSTSRAADAPASSRPLPGRCRTPRRDNSASRFVSQEKFKLWPQAALHTQWPGNGEPDDPATLQLAMSQLPAIADFDKQQPMVRDALIALVDQLGPLDPDDPFAGRRVRLAGGGREAGSSEGDPCDRAQRPARPRARFRRRARLLQGGQARAVLWHHVGADRPMRRRSPTPPS